MPVRRIGNQWRYRKWVGLRDGRRVRISGTPAINTKQAAEAAERAHIEHLWSPPASEKKEVVAPRFEEFAEQSLAVPPHRTSRVPSKTRRRSSPTTSHRHSGASG